MTTMIRTKVTASYGGRSYSGEAETEQGWPGDRYRSAHMPLIRDLPTGSTGDQVPLRDGPYDAGFLTWTPDGWHYNPPEFSRDEQHLLGRLARDDGRYGDCRGPSLDRLRAKGLVTWNPANGYPTEDDCWVSLTKAGFEVADRLLASDTLEF